MRNQVGIHCSPSQSCLNETAHHFIKQDKPLSEPLRKRLTQLIGILRAQRYQLDPDALELRKQARRVVQEIKGDTVGNANPVVSQGDYPIEHGGINFLSPTKVQYGGTTVAAQRLIAAFLLAYFEISRGRESA